MTANDLSNPLLRKSTRFGYYSALDENTTQDPVDPDPREGSGRYKEVVARDLYGAGSMVGRQDYIVGEDGNYYNEEGERVYYWVRPRETDSTMRDYGSNTEEMSIGQDMGGYYTEAEIKAAWDAKEGMGYFKEQTDWDNYWSYLTERQGLIQSGELPDPTTQEYQDQFPADEVDKNFTGSNLGSSFGDRREEVYYAQTDAADQEAKERAMAAFVDANSGLMEKYGIQSTFQNSDGDTFEFNGSTYVRTDKVDDSFDVGGFLATVALSAITAGAAAALAPALAGAIGVSNSVAKAVISAGLQIAKDGEVDLGTALSLAGANIPGVGALDEVTDVSQDVIDDALAAVVNEITNPDNYGKDDNNKPVFTPTEADITGETTQDEETDEFNTEFGVDVDITMPRFPMDPDADSDDDADGGGGGGTDGETEEEGGAPEGGEEQTPATDVTDGDMEGDDRSPQYYEIDENGDVYVIYDPDGNGTWNEDGTWGGEWRKIGNTNDEFDEVTPPWWSGAQPGQYGQHGENTIDTDGTPGQPKSEEEDDNTSGSLPNITLGGGSGAGGTGGTGGSGSGPGGGTPGTGGGVGGGSGTGTGPGTGPGQGPGEGGGDGDFGLEEAALLAGGGMFQPQWGELFGYTTLPGYQKKGLMNPYTDYS